ncbi:SDR family oxidoreductase [Planctopirus hydrillae]|uniref:Short-chain dehydrogenase n=1 Tax=Planctopirus hydrillae TaxID=1841610 RepID=A0A1C3EFE6_9PLAN|nr:SDR family oxidoreductase [Planctopirus hydrillae]ODA31939.1 hypothetical protein A6X21_21965 [Planctopirus hydrillae]
MKVKSVIVTGGSRGYGSGIAEAFVNAGHHVWITGRDLTSLESAAHRIGAEAFVADATDSVGWDRLIDSVLSTTGRLDVLVNNAGEGVRIAPVSEQSDDDMHRSVSSNLIGAMLGSRRAAAIMQEQGDGLIVNIGSVCSKHAWGGWSVYSAAKAGLLMFTRCLLTEMRPHGVRVTSILPSWGQTEFTDSANLPSRGADVEALCISPDDLGRLVVHISELPPHLVAEEITLWPMVQPISQL